MVKPRVTENFVAFRQHFDSVDDFPENGSLNRGIGVCCIELLAQAFRERLKAL
jgi:hypothetical protein